MDRLRQPAVLVGRGGEYALIGAFLDRAAADGAIPLRDEPGAGRTVLLDAAADGASAAGTWVLRAGGARELAGRSPPRWTRQGSPELRHMAGEVPSALCSTVSRRGYPRPAAAYTAAGRTGGDIPTICDWEAPDEPACTNIAELGFRVGDHVCAFYNGGNALDDIVVDYVLKGLQATRRPQFIMCLYELDLFDGEAVTYVLQMHPKTFVNGMIIRNPRYIPRQQFLGSP